MRVYFLFFVILLATLSIQSVSYAKKEAITTDEAFGRTIWIWDDIHFSKTEMNLILSLNPQNIGLNESVAGPIYRESKTDFCCKYEMSNQNILEFKKRILNYKKIKNPDLQKLIEAKCKSLEFEIHLAETMIAFCKTLNTNVLVLDKYNTKHDKKIIDIVKKIDLTDKPSKKLYLLNFIWQKRIRDLHRKDAFNEEAKYWKIFEKKYLKKHEIIDVDAVDTF